MEFYNLQDQIKSNEIELIFPGWNYEDENVVIFSPHDDDAILGAGYLILACLEHKANVHVIIFCDGSAGYSILEHKQKIIKIRKKETQAALEVLGISRDHTFRFNLPDFSSIHHIGWKFPWVNSQDGEDKEGLFAKVVSDLRDLKTTRLILPNGYREHIDHTAVYLSALFDGPQVGDPVLIDHGNPIEINTFLQYSVWAKFSPENALIYNREGDIRANRAILVERQYENKIKASLEQFKSQAQIISNLIQRRESRKYESSNQYLEVYLEMDPRPRFDSRPYLNLINKINQKS